MEPQGGWARVAAVDVGGWAGASVPQPSLVRGWADPPDPCGRDGELVPPAELRPHPMDVAHVANNRKPVATPSPFFTISNTKPLSPVSFPGRGRPPLWPCLATARHPSPTPLEDLERPARPLRPLGRRRALAPRMLGSPPPPPSPPPPLHPPPPPRCHPACKRWRWWTAVWAGGGHGGSGNGGDGGSNGGGGDSSDGADGGGATVVGGGV